MIYTHGSRVQAYKHTRCQNHGCQQRLRLDAHQVGAVILTCASDGVLHRGLSVSLHCNTDDQRTPVTLPARTSTQQDVLLWSGAVKIFMRQRRR